MSPVALGLLVAIVTASQAVMAADTLPKQFRLIALSKTRAIVAMGPKRHVLSVGDATPEGIELLEVTPDIATFRYRDREESLSFDSMGLYSGDAGQKEDTGETSEGPEIVTLYASRDGFYNVEGIVNGYPLPFLIDTGANIVALSTNHAKALGLRLKGRKREYVSTAGGTAEMVRVQLDSITIGGITVYNVEAAVLLGPDPETPLLGMSFLRHVNIKQESDRMELIER